MDGPDCPIHHTPMWLMSTINQWRYYCKACDQRYNEALEPMPPTWSDAFVLKLRR